VAGPLADHMSGFRVAPSNAEAQVKAEVTADRDDVSSIEIAVGLSMLVSISTLDLKHK
jgi:hypothetical protein